MREAPQDLTEREVVECLAAQWGIKAKAIDYVPIGGGSHHWKVKTARGPYWVTVDDLDEKGFLGADRRTVLRELRRALRTASCGGRWTTPPCSRRRFARSIGWTGTPSTR